MGDGCEPELQTVALKANELGVAPARRMVVKVRTKEVAAVTIAEKRIALVDVRCDFAIMKQPRPSSEPVTRGIENVD